MLKLKLQYFAHLMWRVYSLEKTLMLAKIEGNRRQRQRMRWLESIMDSMDMNLSKPWEIMEDRGERCAAVHGIRKSQTRFGDWATMKTTTQNRSSYAEPSLTWLLLFSRSVMSDSLQPHGLQHARLPCPSPPPRACSNSCPLSLWCHPTNSSAVVPFSSHLQSSAASGFFLMSQLFTTGGQSIAASGLPSVLSMNIQDWSPLGWTGWISLQSKGLSRIFSNTTVQKHQLFNTQPSLLSNSHSHTWPLEKP